MGFATRDENNFERYTLYTLAKKFGIRFRIRVINIHIAMGLIYLITW